MFKNVLVSVSEKEGLDSFLGKFVAGNMRIVSSGGTAKYLKEKGFKVIKVSEQTLFPEVMDGESEDPPSFYPHTSFAEEGGE